MGAIHELHNATEHDQFTQENHKAIIFFGSVGCSHCRNITPVYNNYADVYPNIAFGHVETSKVKVDNLEGVPTFVGYVHNQPIDKVVGEDKEGLNSLLDDISREQ